MTAHRFLTQQMKVVRILWAALTFSNVLLGVVTVFNRPPAHQEMDPQMPLFLGVFALAAAVASFVVPKMQLAKQLRIVRVEVFPADSPQPAGAPAGRFAQPEKAIRRAFGIALTPFILSMALSEAVSMVGLALHMVGGPLNLALGLIAAGTLLAASRFPTPARLLGPFERAQGATFAASEGGS